MPDKKARRLDSLSRLLERGNICAAVYAYGNKIYVTANDLKEIDRSKIKELETEIKKEKFDEDSRSVLIELIEAKVKKDTGRRMPAITLSKQEVSAIIKKIVEEGFSKWEGTTIGQLQEEYKTYNRIADAVFVSSIASRLAVDFAKVKDEVRTDDKSALLKKDAKFYILDSKEGVHAEMIILEKLLEKGISEKSYIGISRKCCDNCTDVIKAANNALLQDHQVRADDSEDQLPEIEFRDSHRQIPKGWTKPDFLEKTDPPYDKGSYQRIREAYKKIISEKPKGLKDRYDQLPEDSDSSINSPSYKVKNPTAKAVAKKIKAAGL